MHGGAPAHQRANHALPVQQTAYPVLNHTVLQGHDIPVVRQAIGYGLRSLLHGGRLHGQVGRVERSGDVFQ